MDIKQFVNCHKIRIETKFSNESPPEEFARGSNSWKVTLKMGRKRMTVPFYTGPMSGEPTTERVLECLASDAGTVEFARNFEEWARELGYSSDSIKAEKIYKQCIKHTQKLKQFLGEVYDQIYEIEY